jgi:TRAP-type C4-dicarboxylate transport system permease small subunit
MPDQNDEQRDVGYAPAVAFATLLLIIVGITHYEVVARFILASPRIWAK